MLNCDFPRNRLYSDKSGAVAQLGEHHVCNVGVVGSSPIGSIATPDHFGRGVVALMELSQPTSLHRPLRPARGLQAMLIVGAAFFSRCYIAWAVDGWGWHDWRGFFEGAPRDAVSFGSSFSSSERFPWAAT